ncbi:MAG: hypothetical protein ISR43_01755 [Acidimicrobiia bacterium]|nr:hypothetical protein [Actinomycetota bacterium]MBL6924632.1 hypothetical protein [Acidimicrobiia bacterium]MBL6925937.1 hypothetical protein [Acidimicrobiia bacterium]
MRKKRDKTTSGPGADQTLLDLVNGMRDLEDRVSALESRFDSLGDSAIGSDEDAVMELRLHAARLSAELSRVTVELRGRIAELGNQAGLTFDDEPATPALADDEVFEDLSADSPVRAPASNRTSGWQPAK